MLSYTSFRCVKSHSEIYNISFFLLQIKKLNNNLKTQQTMTQEKKQVLLVNLCTRLPHGVKVLYKGQVKEIQYIEPLYNELKLLETSSNYTIKIEDIKPYLRSLSSMIKEEKEEFCNLKAKFLCSRQYIVTDVYELFVWLNKNHFDYCGLIEMGLALEAPKGMYKSQH